MIVININPAYVPLISALIGAIIGSLSSVLVILIQCKYQNRRDRIKMASELALEDYRTNLELAKTKKARVAIPSISLYLLYHVDVLKKAEKDQLTPQTLEKIEKKQMQLFNKMVELTDKRGEV